MYHLLHDSEERDTIYCLEAMATSVLDKRYSLPKVHSMLQIDLAAFPFFTVSNLRPPPPLTHWRRHFKIHFQFLDV